MDLPEVTPSVFYFRNRGWILLSFPLVAVLCFLGIRANLSSGQAWLNWLVPLIMWLYLAVIALRRRLEFHADGLEYVDVFSTLRIPWGHATRLIARTTFWLWRAAGLEAWTDSPESQDIFIDLSQFSKSWKQGAIGAILRMKAPHLFQPSK